MSGYPPPPPPPPPGGGYPPPPDSGYPPPPDPYGGGYPPPPGGEGPPPGKKLSTGAIVGIGIAAAVVLVVIIAGAIKLTSGTPVASPSGNGEVVSIQTEPVSAATNPFTPPIAPPGQTTTDVELKDPVNTDKPVTVKGGQVGLYGGTEKVSQCDKAKLIQYLKDTPDKAAAWADVQGIQVSEIESFVNKTTQTILRSDTRVLNHGWENGHVTSFESVLQYGTAVLVNDYGLPVVKCYCGNPLSAAPYYPKVTYYGPTWRGWNPQNITIIEQNITIINDYTLINIYNGQPFGRPTGTDGGQDGPAPSASPTPSTTESTGPTPTPTITSGEQAAEYAKEQVIAQLVACVKKWGDGSLGDADSYLRQYKWVGKPTSNPDVYTVTVNAQGITYTWQVTKSGAISGQDKAAQSVDKFCASGNIDDLGGY